jgi:serine/threonine protein kinase
VSDVLLVPQHVETDLRLGHYALWNGGLHHRDISKGNLMFSKFMDVTIGVLNDFDLAISADEERKFARERTGTWCFMATALQVKPEGELTHYYGKSLGARYMMIPLMRRTAFDAESFMWYLVWTTEQFIEGGKEQQFDKEGNVKPPKFEKWDSLSGNDSPAHKVACLFEEPSTTKWHAYSESFSRFMRGYFEPIIRNHRRGSGPTRHEPVFLPCYNSMTDLDMVYKDWYEPRRAVKGDDAATKKLQQRSLIDKKLWSRLTCATYGIETGPYVPSSFAFPA